MSRNDRTGGEEGAGKVEGGWEKRDTIHVILPRIRSSNVDNAATRIVPIKEPTSRRSTRRARSMRSRAARVGRVEIGNETDRWRKSVVEDVKCRQELTEYYNNFYSKVFDA